MSAICGIFHFDGSPLPAGSLNRMMTALKPHGPDGSQIWQGAQGAMGHQMMHDTPESLLEILPRHDRESGQVICSDGRLDNREDLLPALGLTQSCQLPDSDLMLRAYQKWGAHCAEHLVGEFAFVIWDGREGKLHCFTDPMGIRPLFYAHKPHRHFAFASEVCALLALSEAPVPVNQRRLAMLGVSAMTVYLEPEATCFDNIYRVPAASVLTADKAKLKSREHWQPEPEKRLHFSNESECKEAFREVFLKAVGARLRSAFPVASLLSGGLDSSGIVAAGSRILDGRNQRLITLSSVPEDAAIGRVADEREYIDQFRGFEQLDMHMVAAPGCGPFDDLERLVSSASLCSYSYQHFLYSVIARMARKLGARVVLDGDGGELSASGEVNGYLAELLRTGHWLRLAGELRSRISNRGKAAPVIKQEVLRPLMPYSLLKLLGRNPSFRDLASYPLRETFVSDILGNEVQQLKDRIDFLLAEYPDHRKNQMLSIMHERNDLRQRSHAGFVDYPLARFSYPYLDKRMLEFGLGTDGQFKTKGRVSRRLLRLGMEDWVPRKISERTSKAPFSPDYHLRYERDKKRVKDLITQFAETAGPSSLVDFDRVSRALDSKSVYNSDQPMQTDFESQFTVPSALFLCYFLSRFGS